MQKYKVIEKQLKTRSSTYYGAINTKTNQKVLMKKLNKGRTWEELLKDKFINLLKLEKHPWAPKIIQIIKDQDRHYIVFESMQTSLVDLFTKDKSPNTVVVIAKRINQILCQLKDQGIKSPAIKAEYFFVDKQDIKLTHVPEGQQIDLNNASPERANGQPTTQKSQVFQLACLIVEGMKGKPLIEASNKSEYQSKLAKLFPSDKKQNSSSESLRSILKQLTNDFEFIQALQNMLDPNASNRPNLQTSLQNLKKFSTENNLSKSQNSKLLLFSSLQRIDSNKINVLRKCNQISTRFLDDDYLQLSQIPNIGSQTSALPPEQYVEDNTPPAGRNLTKKQMIMQRKHEHPIVCCKMRQKGTETLPKLFNKKEQYTNYAIYKHRQLGVQTDQQNNEGFTEEKFTNI